MRRLYGWAIVLLAHTEAQGTCTAPTANAKDELLHRVACWWHDAGIFNIILTPNYNAAHRNHFHVELTPGAAFID